jgi:methylaspartate mutase epsilon subunit
LYIPTLRDNLEGIELCKVGIAAARYVAVDPTTVAFEREVLPCEVQGIFDSVISLGSGSISVGIVRAFERGYLDIPFSPSIYNAGRVVTIRDDQQAVRFLDPGHLQLDADLKAFHRARTDARTLGFDIEGRSYAQALLLESDIMMIPHERYSGWPLA